MFSDDQLRDVVLSNEFTNLADEYVTYVRKPRALEEEELSQLHALFTTAATPRLRRNLLAIGVQL